MNSLAAISKRSQLSPALCALVWKGVLQLPLGDPATHLFVSWVVECVNLMCLCWASVITWAASQAGMGFQEHMAIDSDYVTPAALLPIAQCVYSGEKKKKEERK